MAGNEAGLRYIFTSGEGGVEETLVFQDGGGSLAVDLIEFLGADPGEDKGRMADAVAAVHNKVVAANRQRG